MADFMKLVQNENMKTFLRARTVAMVIILAAAVTAVSVLWLAFGGRDVSMWDVVYVESSLLYFLVTIFTVVAGAGTVAEEFSSGTIKLLLIRPWSRSKILLSKYISTVAFALFMAALLFAVTLAVNWLCFGLLNDPSIQTSITEGGESPFAYMLRFYGLSFISSIVTVTLAFMLSAVFRSAVLAIALALFLMLIVNNVMLLLSSLPYKWIDYVLFVHLNLTRYLDDLPAAGGMTLGFSLTVLGVYYVLFMAIAWIVFSRRDVAA